MATKKKRTAKVRNIGQEILDGLREINAGKVGRVINRPDVGKVREKTGLSQARLPSYSASPCARFKSGSRDVEHRLGPHARF
jgi:hypothetical protein